MRCPLRDVGGLQQSQEDIEIFIISSKTVLTINRTDILAYASKHQDYESVVKSMHNHRQTANFLRVRVTAVWLQR